VQNKNNSGAILSLLREPSSTEHDLSQAPQDRKNALTNFLVTSLNRALQGIE